uniref:Bestrophin homolog n=1 Tax=Panagrellus redivivus TaxID=6233 RepID=A0A7E4W2U0_PANRE
MKYGSLSDNVIMSFIECFLHSPEFPMVFEWNLKLEFDNLDLQPISNKVKERMTAAGYVWDEKDGDSGGHSSVLDKAQTMSKRPTDSTQEERAEKQGDFKLPNIEPSTIPADSTHILTIRSQERVDTVHME